MSEASVSIEPPHYTLWGDYCGSQPSFHPRHTLPWADLVEQAFGTVRQELEQFLDARGLEMNPNFNPYGVDIPGWRSINLQTYLRRYHANQRQFPRTVRLLESIPGFTSAFLNLLEPHSRIPPHHGDSNTIVRHHLGLVVPRDTARCRIRVGDEERSWEEGKVLVFDDTYEHEVRNDTPDRRVVLFVDFDRPMDWIGSLINRFLVFLIRVSNYVQVPLKNLADWNKNLQNAR